LKNVYISRSLVETKKFVGVHLKNICAVSEWT